MEPGSTTILGYKPAMMILALIGSALSLQFAKGLKWWQGIMTVLSGFCVSVVAVPGYFEFKKMAAVAKGLDAPTFPPSLENAASFFIGMFSMAVVSLIFVALEKVDFPDKVSRFLDKKLGIDQKGGK